MHDQVKIARAAAVIGLLIVMAGHADELLAGSSVPGLISVTAIPALAGNAREDQELVIGALSDQSRSEAKEPWHIEGILAVAPARDKADVTLQKLVARRSADYQAARSRLWQRHWDRNRLNHQLEERTDQLASSEVVSSDTYDEPEFGYYRDPWCDYGLGVGYGWGPGYWSNSLLANCWL